MKDVEEQTSGRQQEEGTGSGGGTGGTLDSCKQLSWLALHNGVV